MLPILRIINSNILKPLPAGCLHTPENDAFIKYKAQIFVPFVSSWDKKSTG